MTKLSIAAQQFRWLVKAVHPFVSGDEARPALEAIRLKATPDRLTLEATDSYALARAWEPVADGPTFEAVVDGKLLRAVVKAMWARGPQPVTLERTDTALTVDAPYGTDGQRQQFSLPLASFAYPSTDEVVAKAELDAGNGAALSEPVGFSPWLLARLEKVPAAGHMLQMQFTGPLQPVLVTWPGRNILVVLMPAKLNPVGEA
jgi:DNA polymerase III sliding clamp (beta) subunit (PCNA family)